MRSVIANISLCLAASLPLQAISAQDSRIAVLTIPDDGNLTFRTAQNVTQSILFRSSERVLSVQFDDPAAFSVTISAGQDGISVAALSRSTSGIMTVRTNLKNYSFKLIPGQVRAVPRVVRLVEEYQPELPPVDRRFPVPSSPISYSPAPQPVPPSGIYRLSGSATLRPMTITDDGRKTFIMWSQDQALPATFALGPTDEEEIVDGYMRGSVFTIDRVYQTLIFRIDKESAKATRLRQDVAND